MDLLFNCSTSFYNQPSDKELKRDIRCVGELTEEEVGKFLVLYKKSIDDLVKLFSGDQRMKEYLGV